jgi:hypothetical protein
MTAIKEGIPVQLTAVSPVAFMLAKVGDKAIVKRSAPKLNEYRDKIGPASEAYLVFKGETKIGLIPREFIGGLGDAPLRKVCRIAHMDRALDMVVVELFQQEVSSE